MNLNCIRNELLEYNVELRSQLHTAVNRQYITTLSTAHFYRFVLSVLCIYTSSFACTINVHHIHAQFTSYLYANETLNEKVEKRAAKMN